MPDRHFTLRGGNSKAFRFSAPGGEMVLSGPAGTGKTVAALLKLLQYGEQYPGSRQLVVRKTRVSLTESGLVTWERIVLGGSDPIIGNPINRGNRQIYRFPNGSELVVGGMDRPDKILSTEFDRIYCQEATELSLVDWETLKGRCRNGAGPDNFIFGDCNPTTPAHWIHKRAEAKRLTLIPTTHRDNPRFWDRAANDFTPEGRDYVVRTLGTLTGARRKRFLEGIWVAAEGAVYDGFNEDVHLLPAAWTPPAGWRRVWAIDWGFRDPLVIQFWAVDPAGRMYLYREIFRTNMRVETAAKQCRELIRTGQEPRPEVIVGDHDPECIATFRTHSGLSVRSADKADKDEGLQAVQGRFDIQPDGRPRIFFHPNARCHAADAELENEGRPASTLEELRGYTWKKADPEKPKDEPIEINDHGMDCLRYADRAAKALGAGGLATGDEPKVVPAHAYD